jgi:predicted N-acetyltransferase YhbS
MPTPDVDIRPMRSDDVAEAQRVGYASLQDAGRSYGWEMPEPDDESRLRGVRRIEHVLEHDPGGAWVAVLGDEIVGVALATRRGPLWFLSLLAVSTQVQSRGVGRRLLDASMTTLDDAGALCASTDPKAVRRYRRAGFAMLPGYRATGTIDPAALPALRAAAEATAVRDGDFAADRSLVDEVAVTQRGAPHGPDLDFFAGFGMRLFVVDSPGARGYAVGRPDGLSVLGATDEPTAAALLGAVLAATTKPVDLMWLTGSQQWALDVALDARLSIVPGGSVCVRGSVGPMSPYIPSGLWG